MSHLIILFFWDRVWLCSSGWPQACNPPASVFWLLVFLGMQHHTRLDSQISFWKLQGFWANGKWAEGGYLEQPVLECIFSIQMTLCLDSKMVSVENWEVRDGQGRRMEGHQKWQFDRVSSRELSVSSTVSHPSQWPWFTQGPGTPEFPVTSKMSLYSQFHKAINVYDDLEPSRGANYTLFTLIEGRRLHNTLN